MLSFLPIWEPYQYLQSFQSFKHEATSAKYSTLLIKVKFSHEMQYLSRLWILSLRCGYLLVWICGSSNLSWLLRVFPCCFHWFATYISGLWALLQLLVLIHKRKCWSISNSSVNIDYIYSYLVNLKSCKISSILFLSEPTISSYLCFSLIPAASKAKSWSLLLQCPLKYLHQLRRGYRTFHLIAANTKINREIWLFCRSPICLISCVVNWLIFTIIWA